MYRRQVFTSTRGGTLDEIWVTYVHCWWFVIQRNERRRKRKALAASRSDEDDVSTEEVSDGNSALNKVHDAKKLSSSRHGPKSDVRKLHWHTPGAITEPGKLPYRWQFKRKYCNMYVCQSISMNKIADLTCTIFCNSVFVALPGIWIARHLKQNTLYQLQAISLRIWKLMLVK